METRKKEEILFIEIYNKGIHNVCKLIIIPQCNLLPLNEP